MCHQTIGRPDPRLRNFSSSGLYGKGFSQIPPSWRGRRIWAGLRGTSLLGGCDEKKSGGGKKHEQEEAALERVSGNSSNTRIFRGKVIGHGRTCPGNNADQKSSLNTTNREPWMVNNAWRRSQIHERQTKISQGC